MDYSTWHDQKPTHPREHQLVTRARHIYENRAQEYENAWSNWQNGLDTTAEDVEAARVLMQQACQDLQDARHAALNNVENQINFVQLQEMEQK